MHDEEIKKISHDLAIVQLKQLLSDKSISNESEAIFEAYKRLKKDFHFLLNSQN